MERERLLKKDMFDLKKLKAMVASVQVQAEEHAANGRTAQAKQKLLEKKKLTNEISILENKIANQKAIEQSISTAASNAKHVELMAAGASELKTVTQQTDGVDIDDVLDKLRDGMRVTEQHSSRLGAPLMQDDLMLVDDDQLDDELDALMGKKYNLPNAPNTNIGGGKPEMVGGQQQGKVPQQQQQQL